MRRTLAFGTAFVLATAAPVAAQSQSVLPAEPAPLGVARVAAVADPAVLGVARVGGDGSPCGDPCDPCAAGACAPAFPPGVCPGPDCPPPEPRVPWRKRWDPCAQPPPYWVSAEYLLWHVSSGPQMNNLGSSSGAQTLGQLLANPALVDPGTRSLGYGMSSGLRLGAGHWFGPYNRLGAEVSGFVLERKVDGMTLASDSAGSPAIVRPFTNANTGARDYAVVALPNVAVGQLTTQSVSRVAGVEANALLRAVIEPDHYFTPLVGLRYMDLDEDLDVLQRTTLINRGAGGFAGRPITAGQGVSVVDRFDTRSQFLGGQFGAKFGARYDRLDVGAVVKVGFGWAHHYSSAHGSTTLTGPGGGAQVPGGVLVSTTSGYESRADDMAVIPELGLNLGYDVAPWLRLTAGYSALYWSRVARPGAQVQTVVDPSQVPSSLQFGRGGPAVPPPPLVLDGLWINGVQFGAVVRF